MAGTKEQALPHFNRLRKSSLGKLFIAAFAAFFLYTLAGFFLVPYLIERQLSTYVTESLGRSVAIEQIHFNPYAFIFEVNRFSLAEADGSLLAAFDRLFVDLDLKGVLQRAWLFDEIRLDKPVVRLDIDPLGDVNWARLIASASSGGQSAEDPKEGTLPRLIIEHIEFNSGQLDFIDRSDPTAAEAVFEPIDLVIDHLTTLAGERGSETIRITEPGGGTLEWSGKLSLQPMRSEGKVVLRNWKPELAWRFLQDELHIKEPGGTIEAEFAYQAGYANSSVELSMKQLQLHGFGISLTMEDELEPFLVLSDLELFDGHYDLAENGLIIGRLRIADGAVATEVDPTGLLSWQRLVEQSSKKQTGNKQSEKDLVENQSAKPFRLQVEELEIGDITFRYEDHSAPQPFGIEVQRLGMTLAVQMAQQQDGISGEVNNLAVDIDGLQLNYLDNGESLIDLTRVGFRGGQIDLMEQTVAVDEIVLSGGRIGLWRDEQGSLNWLNLIRRETADMEEKSGPGTEKRPWVLAFPTILMDGVQFDVADRTLSTPELYTLDDLKLKVSGYSSAPGTEFQVDLSAKVRQGGLVKISGTVGFDRKEVTAAVDISEFSLTPLASYAASVTNAILSSAYYSLNGELQFLRGEDAFIRFKGDSRIADLRIDLPDSEEPLIAFKAMDARGISLNTAPQVMEIDELIIDQPVGRLTIREDMSLNVLEAIKPPAEEGEAVQEEPVEIMPAKARSSGQLTATRFPAKVKHLQVNDGTLAFADLSLRPRFSALIQELNGKIVGLSTETEGVTAMELKGRVGEYGSTDISGELHPFDPKSHSDVNMLFNNIEMDDFTPYSAKFAGRKINSGRLSAEIDYQVRNSSLQGQNRVILDSLVLGERIEDSEAPDLPLDLALALLKDADGRINLDLPVTGDLEDPEFHYGQIIWKALVNVIEKVVTAPFQAIGHLLGIDHEGLEESFFGAGSAVIPPSESEKLMAIARALLQRPELAITVQGRYQPQVDAEALKVLTIKREITVAIGYELVADEDPSPLDYTDAATQAFLEQKVFEQAGVGTLVALQEKFGLAVPSSSPDTLTEPETADGAPDAAKSVSKPDSIDYYHELFTLLVEQQQVGKELLLALAQARSKAIFNELVLVDGVAPERIIIQDPSSVANRENDKVSAKLDLTHLE